MIKYPYITDLYRIPGRCAHPERGVARRLSHVDSRICTTNLGFFFPNTIPTWCTLTLAVANPSDTLILSLSFLLTLFYALYEKVRSLPSVSFAPTSIFNRHKTREQESHWWFDSNLSLTCSETYVATPRKRCCSAFCWLTICTTTLRPCVACLSVIVSNHAYWTVRIWPFDQHSFFLSPIEGGVWKLVS